MKRKEVNEETKQNRQLRRLKPKTCDGSCRDCFCTGYGLGSNTQRPFEDIYNSADCEFCEVTCNNDIGKIKEFFYVEIQLTFLNYPQ